MTEKTSLLFWLLVYIVSTFILGTVESAIGVNLVLHQRKSMLHDVNLQGNFQTPKTKSSSPSMPPGPSHWF